MPVNDSNTKIHLIKVAGHYFAEYGYDGTSTRQIASRTGVAQSAISFHFGSKENLCKAVIEYTIMLIKNKYSHIISSINRNYNEGMMTRELAWGYIDRLLEMQIAFAFDPIDKTTINLVVRESTFPAPLTGMLSNAIYDTIEGPLSRLIMTVSGKKDVFWASMISRAINGSVFTFTEHPVLSRNVLKEENAGENVDDGEIRAKIKDYLHVFLINSIRSTIPDSLRNN